MRRRPQAEIDPAFTTEQAARKQAEREVVRDAMNGTLQAAPIEWIPRSVVPTEVLRSARVQLRPWTDADREPFAAMTADPVVMRYFPSMLTRKETDAWVDRTMRKISERGWGLWALDYTGQPGSSPQFAGFTGLNVPDPELPFGPCVEVGWRLAPQFWGLGLASEAAQLALSAGFESLGLSHIVAISTLGNKRSRAVMERLGMQLSATDDFDHPSFPPDHPDRRCCVYRLPRTCWSANRIAATRENRI
jgi:RimJ/RimL family protein N-acetyltransferase